MCFATHESSSPYSFQRSRGFIRDFEVIPSKLNSAVLTETPIEGAAHAQWCRKPLRAAPSGHTIEMIDRLLGCGKVCGRLRYVRRCTRESEPSACTP